MLMVTVPSTTKRGDLSGTNSFRCHFIFRSSGSLDTRLHNGGVGDPPYHNTMLFMFNAFHVQIDDEDADGDSAAENEAPLSLPPSPPLMMPGTHGQGIESLTL